MLESKWFGALFTLIINMGSGYVLGDVQRLVWGSLGYFGYYGVDWLVWGSFG